MLISLQPQPLIKPLLEPVDDELIGGSGNDTFNGGAGSDTLYGWGGDDIFNIISKSGTYTDTLNGGSGNDTLNVDYGSYGIGDFGIAYNSTTNTITFTDPNSINSSNFEYFTINGTTYRFIYDGYDFVSQQQINNGTSLLALKIIESPMPLFPMTVLRYFYSLHDASCTN